MHVVFMHFTCIAQRKENVSVKYFAESTRLSTTVSSVIKVLGGWTNGRTDWKKERLLNYSLEIVYSYAAN